MSKLKLGMIGNGYLGEIVVRAWKEGLLPEYELVGIVGRSREKTDALEAGDGCRACESIEELLELKPDYIAEAASVEAVKTMAEKILSNGSNLIVLSIGAFADGAFYEKVKETAAIHGTRVYLASGAIGGFDVLRTVTLMGASTRFDTWKGPQALKYTPLFEERLMTDKETTTVFDGNAKGAIELLPTKVNVAVAASLATNGPENTKVTVNSVPGMIGDDHRITAEMEGIKAVVDIYSSTSEIAGWSVVAVLQNIVSPIVF